MSQKQNTLYQSFTLAIEDTIEEDLAYAPLLLYPPVYLGLATAGTIASIAIPLSIGYFAYKVYDNYYYSDYVEKPPVQKLKGTEGDLWKSFQEALPDIIEDALLIDGVTYFSMAAVSQIAISAGLISATGPFAIPISFAVFGTVGAFGKYGIRKTCNNYYNEGEHDWMCGVAGGAVGYVIKANPTGAIILVKDIIAADNTYKSIPIILEFSDEIVRLSKEGIIGAVNNGLYEFRADKLGKSAEEGGIYLAADILKIENMDGVLSVALKGGSYIPETAINAFASGMITFNALYTVPAFDEYMKGNKTMSAENTGSDTSITELQPDITENTPYQEEL